MNAPLRQLPVTERSLTGKVSELAPLFASRAAQYDRDGTFVAENYANLRAELLFSAAVPRALGGGGASFSDVCAAVRELGRHCASTGLAYAMHSHPVALNVFKHCRGDEKAKATLQKIAAHELIIAGTGANDWLDSKGEATRVEGGYRVNAHKRFVSGGPGADVFVTSAPFVDNGEAKVLHFSVPFSTDGIEVKDNWRTVGMRGTGSNDVVMTDVFVPDSAIVAQRPAGVWHPLWDTILPIAMPIIMSCYVGIATAALDEAVKASSGKPSLAPMIGAAKNALTTAELAVDDMVRLNGEYAFTPHIDVSDAVLTRKSIAASAVRTCVETASVVVGGAGFFQGHPLERLSRDVRAVDFHPLPESRQISFSGRIALGLPAIED